MSEMKREERAAQDAVRALPAVSPSAEYRERVKRAFLRGELAASDASASGGGRGEIDGAGGDGLDEEALPARRSRARWRWLAIAASVAIIAGLAEWSRAPRWEIRAGVGAGDIVVDGRAVAPRELGAPLRAKPGARIASTGEAHADLVAGDRVIVRVTPGSEMTVPEGWRARGGGSTARCEVRAGEIRLVTGPGFPGSRISILTTHSDIEVSGTTLAVFAGADSSCLCVLHGVATMRARARAASADDRGARTEGGSEGDQSPGGATSVPAGQRLTIYGDGRPPLSEEIFPMERMKLEMLRDEARATLRK